MCLDDTGVDGWGGASSGVGGCDVLGVLDTGSGGSGVGSRAAIDDWGMDSASSGIGLLDMFGVARTGANGLGVSGTGTDTWGVGRTGAGLTSNGWGVGDSDIWANITTDCYVEDAEQLLSPPLIISGEILTAINLRAVASCSCRRSKQSNRRRTSENPVSRF